LLASGKPLPGTVESAQAGIAELLVRLAVDLNNQKVEDLALSHARLATFLAPANSEPWLLTAELLAAKDRHREALAALRNVQAADPFAESAEDGRIRLLVAAGDRQAALAEAESATRAPGANAADWARLGDVLNEMERFGEAAGAYDRAIKASAGTDNRQSEWTLWLLKGGALEQADRWPEAKGALEKAHALAPDQPLVLNYLGYAQLERGENVEQATALIAQASKLSPDSAEITDSLGWANFLRGNVRAAIPLLEKAVEGRPDDTEINEHLGDAYYAAGRHYEARYAWQAAILGAAAGDVTRLRTKIESGPTPKLASP
jgi:tetratricopeptide (TPR) repeat protein